MRYMWENHPDIARRWEKEFNHHAKALPEHVADKAKKRKKK